MRTIILTLTMVLLACAGPPPEASGHEGHEEHDDHEEHGEEVSDLDRPLEELFAASCEHNIKTHECEECRYEVGVVRAPASLVEGGLIKVGQTEKRSLLRPLPLTGEVQFDERRVTHVSSQAEGMIRKVHVTLGDRVKKDQPLVEIDSVVIGEAQAEVQEAQAMLKLAQSSYKRLSALRKEGIASEKEYLKAKQELEAAQIRLRAIRGKLSRLGGEGQAGSTGRLVLLSPAEGTVLDMHAVPGEVARSEEPLLTVGDNAALWVWADLYERDIALVKGEQAKGRLRATVAVKAFGDEEFPGTVNFVSPSMSKMSRTVKLRIAVPNPDGRLLAGMFATVKVFLPAQEGVLAVPTMALLEDEGRSFVFIHHHDDYYVRRPVVRGRQGEGWVEIARGLGGTERIVTDGAFLMKSDVLRSKMGAGCAD